MVFVVKFVVVLVYFISSWIGFKNWDKLEELEGVEDIESDVNVFFKKFYKDVFFE